MTQFNPDWKQPGDPLYPHPSTDEDQGVGAIRAMAAILEQPDENVCECGDAAHWPKPRPGHMITDLFRLTDGSVVKLK